MKFSTLLGTFLDRLGIFPLILSLSSASALTLPEVPHRNHIGFSQSILIAYLILQRRPYCPKER